MKNKMKKNLILLVDDDDDDQLIFKEALKEITGDTDCAAVGNGFEALCFLRENIQMPRIIFLDLNMPLMNGIECLREIRGQELWKLIPVVIFTTSNNPADKSMSEKMGAAFFLTKTPDFNQLKARLGEILQNHGSFSLLHS